jgi:hypothetical protein
LLLGFSILGCDNDDKETKPEFSLKESDQISDDIYSLVINERYSSKKIVISLVSNTSIDLNCENQYCDYLIEKNQDFDTILVQILAGLNEKLVNFGEQFHSEKKKLL